MTTETTFYRVRRTSRDMLGVKFHEWLAYSQDIGLYVWTQRIGEADSSSNYDGAKHMAAKHGGKVVTVRHKLIPAKPRTHDRAWALRQLAKGRSVGNVGWAPSGRVYMSESGPRFGDGEFIMSGLDTTDGYILWQEPGK